MMVLLSVALSSLRRTHLPGMDNRAGARLAGMPQTPDEMLSEVSESLTARTGRSMEQWLALVRSSGVDPPDSARLQPGGGPGAGDAQGIAAGRARGRRRGRVPAAGGLRAESLTGMVISTTVTRAAEKHRAMFAW